MGRVKFVTLLVTRECNLRCRYCYVRDYHGGHMALETAKRIAAYELSHAEGYDLVEITFLGGEPFRAFPLIKQLCEWIWSERWETAYCLSAITNGTLIAGDIKDWLIENHERFFLSLSYDGIGDSQDKNRSHSDGAIDLAFFRRYWGQLPVKMTISEENVKNVAGDVIALRKEGILVNDTLAGGCAVWQQSSLDEFGVQLSRLCDYLLESGDTWRSDLLSVDLSGVLYRDEMPLFACGAGESRVTYDYDGTPYRCHLLSPLVLDEGQMQALGNCQTDGKMSDCGACALNGICPTCPGNSFRLYGTFNRRDESLCMPFRYQAFYACRYQAKRILRQKQIGEEDRETLSAIRKLMSEKSWIPARLLEREG